MFTWAKSYCDISEKTPLQKVIWNLFMNRHSRRMSLAFLGINLNQGYNFNQCCINAYGNNKVEFLIFAFSKKKLNSSMTTSVREKVRTPKQSFVPVYGHHLKLTSSIIRPRATRKINVEIFRLDFWRPDAATVLRRATPSFGDR